YGAAEAIFTGEAKQGVAGRGGFGVEVVAQREEPGRVGESRQLDPSELHEFARVTLLRRHNTGARDAQACGIAWNRDTRDNRISLARHDRAFIGDVKAAVAGIGDLAVRELNLKESVALD